MAAITALPLAGPITGAETLPMVQGAATVRVPIDTLTEALSADAAASAALIAATPAAEKNLYNSTAATAGQRLSVVDISTSALAGEYTSDFIGPLSANQVLNFRDGGTRRHAVYSSATLAGAKTFVSGAVSIRTFATGPNAALLYWVRIGGALASQNTEELYAGILPLAGVNPFVARTGYTNLQLTATQARERLFDSDTMLAHRDLKFDERNNAGLVRSSPNLIDALDPAKRLDGFKLLNGGDIIAAAGESVLEVSVTGGTEYSFGKVAGVPVGASAAATYQYDAAGLFIAATDLNVSTLVTHANSRKMLLSIITADADKVIMVAGPPAALPRLYVPFKRYAPAATTSARIGDFEGQKAWFLTDSIGTPGTAWPLHVAERLRLTNYPNDDINAPALFGGSWVTSNQRPNIGGTALEKRVNYGPSAGFDYSTNHIYNRVQYLDASRQIAFIQAGSNGWGTPIGGAMAAADACYVGDLPAAIEQYRVAINTAVDPETLIDGRSTVGAMILVIHKMQLLLPNGAVFFIGTFPRVIQYQRQNSIGWTQAQTMAARGLLPDGSARPGGVDPAAGLTLPEYVEVQERVCSFMGVPFYNPFKRSILRPLIPANLAVNFEDPVHPSAVVGQEKIGRDIARWVEGFAL